MAQSLSVNYETFRMLPPNEFFVMLKNDENKLLIDVRRPNEFQRDGLKSFMNLDVSSSNFHVVTSKLSRETKIYVICQNGKRTTIASKHLARLGFIVFGLMGGTESIPVTEFKLCKTG